MNTIWKYELKPGIQDILMPAGAQVLSAGLDPRGTACVWALVCDTLPERWNVRIAVYGTGHEIPPRDEIEKYRFLGTFIVEGWLVYHAFEVVAD